MTHQEVRLKLSNVKGFHGNILESNANDEIKYQKYFKAFIRYKPYSGWDLSRLLTDAVGPISSPPLLKIDYS